MSALLKDIQTAVAEYLSQQAYFAQEPAITILPEALKDIEYQVDSAVASLGICVVVRTLTGDNRYPNLPGILYDPLTIACQVIESPTTNSAFPPAVEVAEAIALTLHHCKSIQKASIIAYTGIQVIDDNEALIYEVLFQTKAGDGKPAQPTRSI